MRVFKPLQLSLQYRTFSWQDKHQLSVGLLLGFPFDRAQEMLLEQDLWKFLAEQLGKDAMLDMCMPKPQGEVLVYGSYYAPGGKPVSADRVQLRICSVDKSLAVIGNRYWRTLLAPTAPEPFTELPISYEYAFGGKDNSANPTGKGLDEVDVFGEQRLPMPNIEDPNRLITSTGDRPEPAGFGPLDIMWQQRAAKSGTYDEAWQRDHFPGYPPDLDWSHFNAAPQDQWINEFWRGDESYQLSNMHPSKAQISGSLPAFRTRCFVDKQLDKGAYLAEVEMRAETVCLFPAAETGVLIYRGVIDVKEDDASDIEHLLVAYENLDQPPRAKDYYDQALRNRLDESKVFKYMMSTRDIIPETERCGFARIIDGTDQDGSSDRAKNMQAKAEAENLNAMEMLEQQKETLKVQLQRADIDPAPYLEKFGSKDGSVDDPDTHELMKILEKILPGSTHDDGKGVRLEEIDFSQFDELEKKSEAMAQARTEEARQQLEELVKQAEGTESEQLVREKVETALKEMDEASPLPRPDSDEMLEGLRTQMETLEQNIQRLRSQGVAEDQLPRVDISLEDVERKLAENFSQLKAVYLSGAHQVSGKPPHKVPMDIVQHRFKKSVEAGRSLAGSDLSGVDASGMDLSGMDLSECYLEYTNLSNTRLKGANLDRAIITHADLRHADLSEASLEQANLGDSRLNGADFTSANLNNAVLSKADLSGARLVDCNLKEVDFLEARMETVNMNGSRVEDTNFLNIDFSGGRFVGCCMAACNFVKCTLENVDFSRADLSAANFVECKLDNSRFVEADMANARFLAGCSLKNSNFDTANLDKANLRDTEAENSRFEQASFSQADFGGANLQNTRFYGAVGKRAMFIKSDLGGADFSSVNLMEGSLLKARLTNADLRNSNFYAVEFMNAIVGGTDFSGANLDLTKLENWSPPK